MPAEEDDGEPDTFGDWDTTTVWTTIDVLLVVCESGKKPVVIVEPGDPPASVGEVVGVAPPPPPLLLLLLLLLLGVAAVFPVGEPAGDDVVCVGDEVLVVEIAIWKRKKDITKSSNSESKTHN